MLICSRICRRFWLYHILIGAWSLQPLASIANDEWTSDFSGAEGFSVGGDAQPTVSGLACPSAGWAVVKDSGDFHVGDEGLTLSAIVRVVRPKERSGAEGVNIFSKGEDWFLMVSSGGRLFFRFMTEEGSFAPALEGGDRIPDGQWKHCAVTVARISRPEKGEMGYEVKLYVDGERIAVREYLHIGAKRRSSLVNIGYGPTGAVCPFCGTIRKASMWRRVLSEDEIEREAMSSGLVRARGIQKCQLTGAFRDAISKVSGEDAEWRRGVFVRAAELGADQSILTMALTGGVGNVCREFDFPRSKALVLTQGAGPAFPLIGFKDKRTGLDVFGRRTFGWELEVFDGEMARWFDRDDGWSRSVAATGSGFVSTWKRNGVTVSIEFVLLDGRIESKLRIDNDNPSILLRNVTWPSASCAKLGGRDRVLIPFMAGIEHFDPTEKTCEFAKQDNIYPSCNMNLPMGAYYNECGGLYYGMEDESASAKRIFTVGRRGNLDFGFQQNIAFRSGQKGGNSYEQPGVGVVEVFRGDWFDAGQIYKRFLTTKKPFWWVDSLPRVETPKWFRDLCVTFNHTPNAKNGHGLKRMRDDIVRMRKYFELPMGVHTRQYTRHEKTGFWPHYTPDADRVAYLKELGSHDLRIFGYIDDRLWCTTDSPDKEHDWMYGSVGSKYRVLHENGETPFERYPHSPVYDDNLNVIKTVKVDCAVMCPSALGWREWLTGQCVEIAEKTNLDGIYHDQIMACAPFACFNPDHGHDFNDAKAWVEGGYHPYLMEMRRRVAAVNPGMIHSSEDGAEPYCAGQLDCCLNWRWNYESVPLYASLYAGRFQFYGRVMGDGLRPGTERGGSFVKLAEELVRSEKIGSFYRAGTWGDIEDKELMLFAKRMAHLRHALLPYLNESEFLRPPAYRSPMPRVAYVWNRYPGGLWKVHSDQVQASAWRRQKDGVLMAVFVNSEDVPIDIEPILPAFGKSVVFVSGKEPEDVCGGNVRMSLPGRGFAVVISGDDLVLKSEGERLRPLFRKIESFVKMNK